MTRATGSGQSRPSNDRRGSVSVIMAASAVPFIVAMGVGVDMSRVSLAKAALQSAVDGAALAGAGAYYTTANGSNAEAVATRFFDKSAGQETGMTPQRTATAAPGQFPGGAPSMNVTVSASASVPTTFSSLTNGNPVTITARAVAANPLVQPVVTLGPVGSDASDWNSAYMYAVPNGADGKPNYNAYPALSQFYEIGSNCNNTNNKWTTQSRCNGKFGATVPATQNFPEVSATQPLAFMFVNMNNGQASSSSQGYGANAYGAQPGYFELMTSAEMSLNRPPSYNTDASVATIKTITGSQLPAQSTNYSRLNGTSKPNCAIQIIQVDPDNLPREPPYPGKCFSATDPESGSQYANLSCAQIAGRTFMYWWNDMGGRTDDYDYKNLYFTIRCLPGSNNPNGGTLYTPGLFNAAGSADRKGVPEPADI